MIVCLIKLLETRNVGKDSGMRILLYLITMLGGNFTFIGPYMVSGKNSKKTLLYRFRNKFIVIFIYYS